MISTIGKKTTTGLKDEETKRGDIHSANMTQLISVNLVGVNVAVD